MADNSLRRILNSVPETLNRADRRNASRMLRDEVKRIENIRIADRLAGAGYPIDRNIRQLLDSCNEERLRGEPEPFTNIWDVFVGFTRPEPSQFGDFLRLRPEKDHAFSAADFFAFATEDELREQALPRLRSLPEGQIWNFTALGDLKEVAFEEEGSDPVVLAGIAMVRFGDHLHWMTVGGPVADLGAITRERREALAKDEERVRRSNPKASEEQIQKTLNPRAVPLQGTNDVWLTLTMGLFNLATAAHEIRILAKDWDVTVAVFSDQFEQRYAEAYETNEQIRRLVDKSVAEINANRIFFEIAETAFMLPAYFAAKVSLVADVEVETGLGPGSASHERRLGLKAPPDMRIMTRHVATLDFGRHHGFDHSYMPPRYRVEVDGFWRRLRPEALGKDRDGNPVRGRTWVRGHARWKDKPPRVGIVHVKTPIGPSIERAEGRAEKVGGTVEVRY